VNLMGLEILEPGCRRVRLAPKRTEFDYRAVFPAPPGPIVAECSGGEVKTTVPDGIVAE
jgi:hypothetical protein